MKTNLFQLNKQAEHTGGRTPIKDRGIKWEESYEERSAPLKKRFEQQLGPGSYFRWAGYDTTTNSDYFIVVGPSVEHNVGKMFFAGIKKLPHHKDIEDQGKSYSPYGEYYPTMRTALIHANEKWAVPLPQNVPDYTKEQLANVDVPEHVKA